MAPLQKPAHALVSAIRHLAAPLSIDPSVTAEGVEDDATNAALAVLRLDRPARSARPLIAIELVCAAQAVDLAAPARLGAGTAAVHGRCASWSSRWTDDRPLSADIERVAAMIAMTSRAHLPER